LAGSYAGISNVDRTVVDAARSMGMGEMRVLLRVEVPNALPLIVGGLRTATLQVVATATVAAYASLGGLGRYLIDGIKVRQFQIALVGALMVAVLALILDATLAFAVWASVPGTGRLRRKHAGCEATPRRADESAADRASKPPGSSPTVDA
jgi:osmoprotectant transport system permease protein